MQEAFVSELKKMIAEFIDEKIDLLARVNDSKEFYLRFSDYPKQNQVKKVSIRYNLNFPMIYSISAIEKVYEETIINEDKLLLAYYMISIKVINDVILGQFKREYIVDFPESIIEKKQKRDRLINILDNDLIKERVFIKITFDLFTKNTEYIYELLRLGYKFALVIDSSFESNYANIEKLNIFKYIISSKMLPVSREIRNISRLKDRHIELN